MQCASCQHENSATARFCENCGAPLQRRCASCGEALAPTARFCSQCGHAASASTPTRAAQDEPAAPSPAPLAPVPAAAGERRQLAAMFCDMVGSTALSQQLDPEEFGSTVSAYQAVCIEAISRFGGHVAQLLGDGVLAYFGYPHAHENDPERAIRAGLAIQARLRAKNEERSARGEALLHARIGVHTGPVVVGTVGGEGRTETLALGDTVNVASRIQSITQPGTVALSDATLRLVGGVFVTRDLGRLELRGVAEPMRVHVAERAAGVSAREATGRRAIPLLGRDRELGLLLDRWEQVQDGLGQVVVITGEPGIGKSRLLAEFKARISTAAHTALDLSCSAFSAGSAFQPAIELFERGFGFAESDAPAVRLAKLEASLGQVPGIAQPEVVPYLAALLGLPPSSRFPLEHMSPELQREKTLQALAAPALAMLRLQPLAMFVEDLHWSDPSTLDLLGRLIDQAPAQRMLLVLTHRPGFAPPWPLARSFVTPLALSRLGGRATSAVIEASAGLVLPERVLADIRERSDGIPLFAEELARALVESEFGAASGGRFELRGRIADLEIPMTLQGSLMSRLDRLGPAKQVAQIGATLGREFSYALAEALAQVAPAALRTALDQLVKAEILYVRGEPPDATYTFKHALLQDTAYESQLKSRRRELHKLVAATLEGRFPARVAPEPQVMARHCAEGGLVARAVEHFGHAGRQALARLANPEAADYFARALELLATLPEDDARRQQEVTLRLALSGPLSSRGDAPETIENFTRIEALCGALPAGPARLPAILGLAMLHQSRADLRRSSRWAEELLEVATKLAIRPLEVAAHAMLGAATASYVGFGESCRHFDEMNRLAAETQLPQPSAAFDLDVMGALGGAHAMSLVLVGRPERARSVLESGLARVRALGHAFSHAFCCQMGALAELFNDDPQRTLAVARESLEVARGRGFALIEAGAYSRAGWARVMLGDAGGVEESERGIDLALSTGATNGFDVILIEAADLSIALGRFERAAELLNRAEAWQARIGGVTSAANVPMLRATILLRTDGDLAEAERLLLESIDGWRSVESPWMEVRSACLLGEVALRTRARESARTRLAALLASIHEGAGAARMLRARELVAKLS